MPISSAPPNKSGALWQDLDSERLLNDVIAMEPEERRLTADESTMDKICYIIAEVIDAKWPITYRPSNGAGDAAVQIARGLNLNETHVYPPSLPVA